MKFQTLRTPLVCFAVLATTLVALRAADEKGKAKAAPAEQQPGVIKFETAPAAVQKTFKEETKGSKIELLGKSLNGPLFFRAIVGVAGNDYDISVAEDGQVLEKVLNAIRTEAKLEDCPPAVQKALKEEAKGAKVEHITRVAAGKRADYVIDVAIGKSKYQLVFHEDGTLSSKMIDEGDDAEELPSPGGTKEPEKKEAPKSAKKK
ncbi:hypothetical protein [Schlesneria paludicola]|uniref:hypothetical protein n=1 Tax=Schlesneria paludicola TaxID=360056 RepID=UPI0012F9D939|nr:hypothetical protein [Schlesneria paludicola]